MHYQHQAGQWWVEFENLPCSEPQSIMSENLHQMRLAPQLTIKNCWHFYRVEDGTDHREDGNQIDKFMTYLAKSKCHVSMYLFFFK